jgi:diaminopimelate epimerase
VSAPLLPFCKAHAYGNDFLYVAASDAAGLQPGGLARRLCDRHRGIGADGLIIYGLTADGASMRLVNADGSHAELSGNGLRGLAALVIRHRATSAPGLAPSPAVSIETSAGLRQLVLLGREGARYQFDAGMGTPERLRQETLDAGGESLRLSILSMGNPQCVLLGPLPDDERFARLGAALERHPAFPEGTNVEFAEVLATDRVRIRIWERGVGPTESSGTGTCAAAVAAAAHGGASREVEVIAPGGTQSVSWRESGVHLTGWAELICDGTWLADL